MIVSTLPTNFKPIVIFNKIFISATEGNMQNVFDTQEGRQDW